MNEELKKEIVESLKEAGIEIAEDTAVSVVKAIFKLLPVIVLKTENKLDDLAIPMLAVLEGPIMEMLDGIDGKEG